MKLIDPYFRETLLNTLTQRTLFLVLLGSALLFLPACGSKSTVNTQKAPETVLNPESSSIQNAGMPEGNGPAKSYVEKVSHRGSKSASNGMPVSSTSNVSTPAATAQITPNNTPSMETSAPVKKSGHASWLWVPLVLALGGLIGWYFWSKNRTDDHPSQPMPPVGGLSPVSGFTAVRDKIEDDSETETSIWSKKLF
jgi:hypothetical protein